MYNGCSKSVVALPGLYFHWSLGPVGSFVLRVWGIVCIVSSVLFFCFPIRPCLESEILRVSAALRSLLLFSGLIFWPLVCSTTPPIEILLYQLLCRDPMFIIINLQIISPKVYFVFSRNSLPGFLNGSFSVEASCLLSCSRHVYLHVACYTVLEFRYDGTGFCKGKPSTHYFY